MNTISLVEVPDCQVLGITRTGTYALIPDLLMKVYEYAMEQHAVIAGPPVFVCHETSPEEVMTANAQGTARVEVAWPVSGVARGSGDITVYTLPGGRMVRTVHRGPYDACAPAYERLFAYIVAEGLSIAGPVREVYLNDPHEVAPEEILTEIYAPVM
jgi:effector-binding domain-containing protein